jgi:hypothetical protein
MQLTLRVDGAIEGFTYRVIVQEVNITTGDLLQNEEIHFPQTGASPNEAIVPFWISDLSQREFKFAIGMWDNVVGGAETLLARKDAIIPLTFDFRDLVAVIQEIRQKSDKNEFNGHVTPRFSFEALDADGDGKITQVEYTKGFDMLDTNKDGFISESEALAEDRSSQGAAEAPECHKESLVVPSELGPESKTKNVTLVTVASLDRYLISLYSAAHWDGPVSVAYYARSTKERAAVESFVAGTLEPFCRRRQQTLSVIVISDCPQSPAAIDFPINALRRAAATAAITDLILVVDVDFIPSALSLHHIQRYYASLSDPDAYPHVLVLPCFWPTTNSSWPSSPLISRGSDGVATVATQDVSKQRLLLDFAQMRVSCDPPGVESAHSHFATNYALWLEEDCDAVPYPTEYVWFYEPYVVVNASSWTGMHGRGLFDESFHFGHGDKAQLSWEAAALEYQFRVLPGAFVVHVPREWLWLPCDRELMSADFCEALEQAQERRAQPLKVPHARAPAASSPTAEAVDSPGVGCMQGGGPSCVGDALIHLYKIRPGTDVGGEMRRQAKQGFYDAVPRFLLRLLSSHAAATREHAQAEGEGRGSRRGALSRGVSGRGHPPVLASFARVPKQVLGDILLVSLTLVMQRVGGMAAQVQARGTNSSPKSSDEIHGGTQRRDHDPESMRTAIRDACFGVFPLEAVFEMQANAEMQGARELGSAGGRGRYGRILVARDLLEGASGAPKAGGEQHDGEGTVLRFRHELMRKGRGLRATIPLEEVEAPAMVSEEVGGKHDWEGGDAGAGARQGCGAGGGRAAGGCSEGPACRAAARATATTHSAAATAAAKTESAAAAATTHSALTRDSVVLAVALEDDAMWQRTDLMEEAQRLVHATAGALITSASPSHAPNPCCPSPAPPGSAPHTRSAPSCTQVTLHCRILTKVLTPEGRVKSEEQRDLFLTLWLGLDPCSGGSSVPFFLFVYCGLPLAPISGLA